MNLESFISRNDFTSARQGNKIKAEIRFIVFKFTSRVEYCLCATTFSFCDDCE